MKKETEGQVSKEADLQAKWIYNRVNPQQQVGNSRPPGRKGEAASPAACPASPRRQSGPGEAGREWAQGRRGECLKPQLPVRRLRVPSWGSAVTSILGPESGAPRAEAGSRGSGLNGAQNRPRREAGRNEERFLGSRWPAWATEGGTF